MQHVSLFGILSPNTQAEDNKFLMKPMNSFITDEAIEFAAEFSLRPASEFVSKHILEVSLEPSL